MKTKKLLTLLLPLGVLASSSAFATTNTAEQTSYHPFSSQLDKLQSVKADVMKKTNFHFGGILNSVYQSSTKKMYRGFPVNSDYTDEAFSIHVAGFAGWDFYHSDTFNASINTTYEGYYTNNTFSLTNPISGTIPSHKWSNQLKELFVNLSYLNNDLKIGRFDPTIDVVASKYGHEFFHFLSFQFSGSTWLQPPYPAVGASYSYNFTKDKSNYLRFVATDATGNFNKDFGYKNVNKGDLWKAIELGLSNQVVGEGAADLKITAYHIDKHEYFNDKITYMQGKPVIMDAVKGIGIQGDYELSHGIRPFVRLGFAENSKSDTTLTGGVVAPASFINRSQDEVGLGYSYSRPSNNFRSFGDKNEQLIEGYYRLGLSRYDHISVILSYFKNPLFTDGGTPNAPIPGLEQHQVDSNFITSIRYTVML